MSNVRPVLSKQRYQSFQLDFIGDLDQLINSISGLDALFFVFERLFASLLLLVELGEIIYNYGNGQSDNKDAPDATNGANQLARGGRRHHVAIAHSCHGDQGPPERGWYGRKLGVHFFLFGKIGQTGEQQHRNGQKHHEQTELFFGPFERVAQRLESR
ncbi:molecular chaperone [Brachionus plicatilis]|uniref:Molecular chaperone n=1 Tax=Brachionus plicatilis TaxID=10195 RepID=A0A3M7PNI4_BRAPC|nr:molecular chaperone [Brachionus plicatilis]